MCATERRKRKQDAIRDGLAALALALPRGGRLPTVLELCARFGTTKTTLGRVLDRLERERLVARRRGSGLFAGPAVGQKRVGVVFGGDIFSGEHSPYWLLLMQAAAQAAGEAGMELNTYLDVSRADREWALHRQLAEDLAGRRLDGLIACGMNASAAEWLLGQAVPVVGVGPCRVGIDHDAAIAAGVGALADAGCRRLAFMVKGHRPEEEAFVRHVTARGLLADTKRLWSYFRCINDLPQPVATMEQYGEAVIRCFWPALARIGRRPDGILILDDTMARGAVRALDALGAGVGIAVRIVSIAVKGSPILNGLESRLFRLETDPLEEMRASFSLLAQALADGKLPNRPVTVRPKLILMTGSSAPL